jgi:hypothetical protein
MKTLMVPLFVPVSLAVAQADKPDKPPTSTTVSWVRFPKNPILGDKLGTCFDFSVLNEGDTFLMWFSWRS